MINLRKINLLRDKLQILYNAERVYVFGSYAWGEPTEDSDLDILVISNKFKELSLGKRIAKATDILFDLDFPVDLVVETSEEFNLSKNTRGSLESYVDSKGVVLHG
ncbi:nucleotidyltransferase domain-containing protein [Ilyobacter polytropus]|jgi:predicted nucleotidyltransferase|uniref:DNA polymerase beta domain protein region n=1 Tax=Ilyobacter polytropus (strain ATCC 51220 / DSM 2926 / LMG 16218 / CuHBu1) TaxID=572544 RepID=E3HE37_ILYPC|nr:nucleotidyltransferase domain-containing protein [Ilyobacter polytropus]ADO84649.1 DNA polymerase beta domain protein region [Ilyobacter polytropus DSM 2926]